MKMDLVTCHCRNTRCAQCGKMGNASALQPHGSDRGEVRLRCTACGDVVSARIGTAYAGIRTDLTQYTLGAKLLAEGLGVRATARILEVDKDTVNQWLRSLGPHGAAIMAYHFRHLHLTECQLPAFSANNLPVHVHETGQKSFPEAGLRAGEGVKSGR